MARVCKDKTPAGVHILSIDAKDIYISNHYNIPDSTGYCINNKNGEVNVKKFINVLDYSLDLIKLREIYQRVYRRRDFGFFIKDKEYTKRIINVTFKYSVKEYNEVRQGLYLKNGYRYDDIKLEDCIQVENGELIAIQTGTDVELPVSDSVLGKYFYYSDGQYKAKTNIKAVCGVGDLRNILYSEGFYCDGIHYVRFKRSSGSSRVGKCLFIDEKLYPAMHRWDLCGIKVKDGQDIDLAALEAYIALTLSSIIDTVEINPENILVIDDYESVFRDDVIAVSEDENGNIVSKPDNIQIKNSIFDGQSLMDYSLFGRYSQYGMLLLRNRFFKSCCFNCNIQKFFEDNGITEVSQLKGFTLATDIKDIKLITTPSSIKYVKFGTLQQWLEQIDSIFGIVKHEKKTHFFGGRMVQAHYQLLNTLQMTYDEVKEFVQPSLDYVKLLNNDPAVLRYHIKYPVDDEFYMPETALESKNDIVYKLLGLNDDFAKTKMYAQFRQDLTRSLVGNMKRGHILINGNYETLLGNPIEMLMQSIGKFDGDSILGVGNVHTKRFPYNTTVLGCRSPHINPGNILLTNNVESEDIDRYFNLTEEILCINSIRENILQRLNGADFDSDSIIVTDDSILIESAKRNYDKFLVPTSLVGGIKTQRKYTDPQKSDLDIKTSVNKIGEIVNLSQELNTLMWDALNGGASFEDVSEIYYDSSKLCIMSSIEIDRAKKEFRVDNSNELKKLKSKYNLRDKDGRLVKPNFFGFIAKTKGYYDSKKKNYRSQRTTMDFLQKAIRVGYKNQRGENCLPFSSILNATKVNENTVRWSQIELVLDVVRNTRELQASVWAAYWRRNGTQCFSGVDYCKDAKLTDPNDLKSVYDQYNSLRQECVDYICSMRFSYSTMYYLLKYIDSPKNSDIRTTLFYMLFGAPNKDFYAAIKESATPIPYLEENRDADDVVIFGVNYKKITTF